MNGLTQGSFWGAFGLHHYTLGRNLGKWAMIEISNENRDRLLGYIPLVGGQAKAFGHWKKVYNYNKKGSSSISQPEQMGLGYRIGLVIRGIFEFLGLGLVLLFTLDAGTTLARSINGSNFL